jgi:magnesium-protoporphyrin IX monomethyl ester (oxidative) cyclase
MPFSMLGNPSMALSVLKGEVQKAGLSAVIEYGNLRFAKRLGLKKYSDFMKDIGSFELLGELIFSHLAGFSKHRDSAEYFAYAKQEIQANHLDVEQIYEPCYARFEATKPFIDSFLLEMVEVILSYQPRIVGCDITYQQQNASLALVRLLKERDPSIVTVLGGNSCTGSIGQALADYMPTVDYVFSGEADDLFPEFCKHVLAGDSKEFIHTLFPSALVAGGQKMSWGRSLMANMAIPDFYDYFRSLEEFDFKKHIVPCLLIEGSRGCWWGQKKRCTFCGIHTSKETLQYRQKSSEDIIKELNVQYGRYTIDTFIFTDCILSNDHIRELLPRLANNEQKFKFFAEVKSNLTKDDVKAFREAGFSYLQPGIESLQDNLLGLMNKGNRAIKHVELLKYCRYYGILVVWNLLKDMPGDQAEWYQEMVELLPLISHLQPPTHLNSVIFQRNSSYTMNPAAYGLELEPIELYHYVGLDDENFIQRTAEYYLPKSIADDDLYRTKVGLWQKLAAQISKWIELYNVGRGDRLVMSIFDNCLEISDLRDCAVQSVYTLTGVDKEVYLFAAIAITCRKVRELLDGKYSAAEIDGAIEGLLTARLMIKIGEEILALAVQFPALPYRRGSGLPVGNIHFEDKEGGIVGE